MKSKKPTGTLKKIVDIGKTDTRVIGSLERYLLAQPSGDPSRRHDVIHPSAMAKDDWCHRAQYFELLGADPAPSKYKSSMRQLLVFEEGHRIHARYQKWFGDMGRLFGLWQCDVCDQTQWGMKDDSCVTCVNAFKQGKLKHYLEVPLWYEPLRISGHADGWLKNFGDDLMLEIKSVGEGTVRFEDPALHTECGGDMKKIWSALKAPFTTHINQVQIYMELAELIGLPNPPKEAVVIYESKATQEVKEFIVPKNTFHVKSLFSAAEKVLAAVDKGVPPTCNIDPVNGCYKCNHHMEAFDVEAGS